MVWKTPLLSSQMVNDLMHRWTVKIKPENPWTREGLKAKMLKRRCLCRPLPWALRYQATLSSTDLHCPLVLTGDRHRTPGSQHLWGSRSWASTLQLGQTQAISLTAVILKTGGRGCSCQCGLFLLSSDKNYCAASFKRAQIRCCYLQLSMKSQDLSLNGESALIYPLLQSNNYWSLVWICFLFSFCVVFLDARWLNDYLCHSYSVRYILSIKMQLILIIWLFFFYSLQHVCLTRWAVSIWASHINPGWPWWSSSYGAQLLSAWHECWQPQQTHTDLTSDLSHDRSATQPRPHLSRPCSVDIRPSTCSPPSFNVNSECKQSPLDLTHMIRKVIYDHSRVWP